MKLLNKVILSVSIQDKKKPNNSVCPGTYSFKEHDKLKLKLKYTVGQKKNGKNFVRSYLPELLSFLND
jgi:hypothetical protein